MGIPSYFSYIVRNHINIIKKFVRTDYPSGISNLYLDCNSIIYDSVRGIDFSSLTDDINQTIFCKVALKIEEYIELIGPRENVMIAFDGVAPVAKLEQQRNRRYKSWYQGKVSNSIFNKNKVDAWNTTAITPGTVFMKELSEYIRRRFSKKLNVCYQKMIVSTSDECGEGEHKIFQYIRSNPEEHKEATTVIYGLDADLIMLSINHIPVNPQIYLFRETPEFIKSIDSSLEPNESYLLNIPELASIITTNMNNCLHNSDINRIYDYIFLCFFLGNDFMPHFPSINIRTGGVDKMLNAYKATIGGTQEVLTDGKTIFWKNVRKLVAFLAENEEAFFKTEMKARDRKEKIYYPTDTPEQKFLKFDALPTYDRELEKYIAPFKDGWQERYYESLDQIDIRDENAIKEISINFLEGLEWTLKYYTTGCSDWRWCYRYNYPPLLSDLLKYVPFFERELVPFKVENPVKQLVQLCYVLPRESLQFLPKKLRERLQKDYEHLYPTEAEFIWAFCKYFWESHIDLPEMDIEVLEIIVLEETC